MTSILAIACNSNGDEQVTQDLSLAEISAVLEARDEELLAIPGVVGVYVSLLDDEETPCLKVMVVERTPELDARLPEMLDGYPVIVEETGVIRPLDDS